MDCNRKPLERHAVLAFSYANGQLEHFADRNIDVHHVRVPLAHSRDAERTSEDVIELLLPDRFRRLWRADCLRAVGTTRPLLPSVLADSLVVRDVLAALDDAARQQAPAREVVIWS